MDEELPEPQRKLLARLANRPTLAPGFTGGASPFTGLGEYMKPDDNPWAAAALFRKGLVDRTEASETDRYRGANTSGRNRYFWVYKINAAGLAALARIEARSDATPKSGAAGTARAGIAPKDTA